MFYPVAIRRLSFPTPLIFMGGSIYKVGLANKQRTPSVYSQAPVICKNIVTLSFLAYKWGMASLDHYLDEQLARGRA